MTGTTPHYDHDRDRYKGLCGWLGMHVFPREPIPQMIYDHIAPYMRFTDHGWKLDELMFESQFVESAQRAGMYSADDIPPDGLSLYLKHFYSGMHAAAQFGLTPGLKDFEFAEAEEGTLFKVKVEANQSTLYFCNIEELFKKCGDIDEAHSNDQQQYTALGREAAEAGFKQQARAFYLRSMRNSTPATIDAMIDQAFEQYQQKKPKLPTHSVKPAPSFLPKYKCDPEQYKAACNFLGYLHFPKKPLQEQLYKWLVEDMVQYENGTWKVEPYVAANNFTKQATEEKAPYKNGMSATAYGLFLRHFYRGMQAAAEQGLVNGPELKGFFETKHNITFAVSRSETSGDKVVLGFANLDDFFAELDHNEIMSLRTENKDQKRHAVNMRQIEEMGFMMQAHAHHMRELPSADRRETYDLAKKDFDKYRNSRDVFSVN